MLNEWKWHSRGCWHIRTWRPRSPESCWGIIILYHKNKCKLPSQELDLKSHQNPCLFPNQRLGSPEFVCFSPLALTTDWVCAGWFYPPLGWFQGFWFWSIYNISYRDIFFFLLASFWILLEEEITCSKNPFYWSFLLTLKLIPSL